jgi:hypothetical protein
MSGGSWDYSYIRFITVADHLENGTNFDDKVELTDAQRSARVRLSRRVRELANVLKKIEWVDSYDSSIGEDVSAINAFLEKEDRILQLEEQVAWLTLNRDNLLAQRDDQDARHKAKTKRMGQRVGAVLALKNKILQQHPELGSEPSDEAILALLRRP